MDRDDAAPAATGRPRRRLVALVSGVAVLALVVVVAVALTRGGDGTDPGAGATTSPSGTASSGSPAEPDGDASTGQGPTDGRTADEELPASGPDAQEAPPVGLDASPVVAPGVTLRVKGVTAVDGAASLPGEVTGPAVRVELELTNSSGASVDLASTVVGLAYGAERIPANTFSTGTSSLVGPVDTGSSATGVYVFAVPADEQGTLRLSVDYMVGVPVVVFEGSAS
jgi:hypothetical protein